jgi:hypothetical protein
MPLDDTNWPTIETEVPDETTALLIRARGLIARGWCRGTLARSFLGFQVSPYSTRACRWCPSGALRAARLTASDLVWRCACTRLIAAIDGEDLSEFSDRQEAVEPVLAAFDRAIAADAST